jgi:hypothetical protein
MNTRSKIILSFVLMFLGTGQVSLAQSKFAFGIKGGINLSKLSMGDVFTTRYDDLGNPYLGYDGKQVKDNLKSSLDTKTGYVGGIYARFGRTLFLQPEILVSTKGGAFEIIKHDNNIPVTQTVKIKYSNIDVPLLIGLKGGPLRILAGPVTSFRIGDNQRLRDALQRYTSSNFNDAMAEATFGYQFGAGLDIGKISLDVRKEGSFTNISSFPSSNGEASHASDVKQKMKSWQVTLGIRLF